MTECFINVYEGEFFHWMDMWSHPTRQHAEAHATWFPSTRRVYLLRVILKPVMPMGVDIEPAQDIGQ